MINNVSKNVYHQQDVISLFSSHLETINIAIKIVGGVSVLLIVVGAIMGWKWYEHVKIKVNIELDKYIKSDDFSNTVNRHVINRIESLKKTEIKKQKDRENNKEKEREIDKGKDL